MIPRLFVVHFLDEDEMYGPIEAHNLTKFLMENMSVDKPMIVRELNDKL